MRGIIGRQMGQDMDAPAGATMQQQKPTEEKGGRFMSGAEKAVPPELMEAFDRVVLAGKKVMYSPEMEDTFMQEISREGPIEKNLAEAIVGLMALLDKQSKPRLPLPVIIPAAIELVHDAADFIQKGGLEEITPEQVKTASQLAAMLIAKRYGANDEQIFRMMSGPETQQEDGDGA